MYLVNGIYFLHITLYLIKSSSALTCTQCPYSETLAMQPVVLYIRYVTSTNEQTGYIITFAQFEEGDLVENECNIE